tara:strand:- start:726 stop:920 length:195 start_codon:yes stop_codon:yes gene_type:complete
MPHQLIHSRELLGACVLMDGKEGVTKGQTVAIHTLIETSGDALKSQGFALFVVTADTLAPTLTC